MSAGSLRYLRLEQLVDACFDRLTEFVIQTGGRGCIVALEVVQDTQIVVNLGKLLGLVLEQYSNLETGWEDLTFCRLIRRAATAISIIVTMVTRSVRTSSSMEDPAFERQLAASALPPGLVVVLPDLAEAVEAATRQHPCIEAAAGGVLPLVLGIFGTWPGVLRSRAAVPLVQPTLRLLVALYQYAVANDDAHAFELMATNSLGAIPSLADRLLVQTNRVTDKVQQQTPTQDHPCQKNLRSSPEFLTLLLTVCCMALHPGSAATTAPLAAHLGAATAAAAADRSAPADPKLQMQVTEILQDLYGQSSTASSWHLLLSGSEVVTELGWLGITVLRSVLSGAAACMQQLNAELQDAAASMDAHSSSERHHTQLSLPHQQLLALNALRQLPVLLLGALCSAPAQAATRLEPVDSMHSAAISLVKEVVICWGLQLELQSSSVGIQVEQLPCAELLKVALQHAKLLQQMKLEVAAALVTAQSTADGAGSSTRASAEAAGTTSAVAVESDRVGTLDTATAGLFEVLTLLQTVNDSAVWQPHLQDVAAAVEHCVRSTSNGAYDAATTLSVHQSLCVTCDCLLRPGAKAMKFGFAHSERLFVVKEPGLLLRAAAAAPPDSNEQQQLFTLLISLLKRKSHFEQSGHAARELEDPGATVGKVASQVVRHMLDTLCSNCGSSSSPSPVALLHGMSGSKVLSAAAPWLVASSRLVLHTATQLAGSLEVLTDQLHATSAAAVCDREDHHLRRVLHGIDWVMCSTMMWFTALKKVSKLLQTRSAGGGGDSTGSGRDVDAVCDTDTSVMAATTLAADTGLASVPNAVQVLQQAALQEACRASESEHLSPAGLLQLQQVCSAASTDWQLELEAGQHIRWGDPASASSSTAGKERAVLDVDLLERVVESFDVKTILQELCNVGQRVCAAFPLKYCCNNPMCSNVSSSSEWALVSNKRCTGCATARYCSRECQAAHWPWHKAICKAIKKQSLA